MGTWHRIARLPGWERALWPAPTFGRAHGVRDQAFGVTYSDEDPAVVVRDEPVEREELAALPSEELLGSATVERKLAELLES